MDIQIIQLFKDKHFILGVCFERNVEGMAIYDLNIIKFDNLYLIIITTKVY